MEYALVIYAYHDPLLRTREDGMCKLYIYMHGIILPLPEARPTINRDHWKYKAAQQAQDERMREQQQAAAERAAPKSVAPKSAAEKPAAKPMPSRRVEWLIHNSTAVVEEVPEDENRLVLHEPRRSRQYQSYMAAEAAQKRMRKG